MQTQYCEGAAIGAVNCNGALGAQFVQNPSSMLKGVWVDPTAVPSPIVTTALVENTNDPVATKALRASQHFGYNVNATYFILAQPGTMATAYGTVYCAYHSETGHALGARGVRYAFVPYVPEQGAGCGVDSVNQNDAFGHGYYDSYSIVAGHEFAETTGPRTAGMTSRPTRMAISAPGPVSRTSLSEASFTRSSRSGATQPRVARGHAR